MKILSILFLVLSAQSAFAGIPVECVCSGAEESVSFTGWNKCTFSESKTEIEIVGSAAEAYQTQKSAYSVSGAECIKTLMKSGVKIDAGNKISIRDYGSNN